MPLAIAWRAIEVCFVVYCFLYRCFRGLVISGDPFLVIVVFAVGHLEASVDESSPSCDNWSCPGHSGSRDSGLRSVS